jgi:hypothetical protein
MKQMKMQRLLGSLSAASLAVGAASAGAAPITYAITGGEILVTASTGGAFVADPVALPADGETVRTDLAPGFEEIISLSLTASGPAEIALAHDFGGYQTLRVDALSVTGGPGTLFAIGMVGSESEYFAIVQNIVLGVSFALVDDVLPDSPGAVAIPLGTGTGTLFASVSEDTISLFGFAVANFTHPGFDRPITVKADFRFEAAAIPEPTGAVIFAAGLIPIAGALRRSRTRRS